MLYLTGNYGIGRELVFSNGATIMSEPTARFAAGKPKAASNSISRM